MIQGITERMVKGMSFGTIFVTRMTHRSLFLTEMKKTVINEILKQAVDFEDEIDDDIDSNTDPY